MAYNEVKQQIDALKEKIAAHGKLTDEQKKKINYKFRLEWNYNSNSMEGNTLTVAETRSVMVGNLDVHLKPIKDVIEMQGHDKVITEILNVGKGDARLSEKRIQEIHKAIIHENEDIKKDQIGIWKTANNEIINYKGEKYTFVDWTEVSDKMHKLLDRTNAAIDAIQMHKKNAPHPVDVALDFHLEFLNIHPFYDGNGRTSRILTNLILISLGYTPFWITKPERAVYYNYIADIQGHGGNTLLLNEYIGKLILRSEQLVLDVIEGRNIEEDDDLYKEISLWKKKLGSFKEELQTYDISLVCKLYENSFKPLFVTYLNKFSEFDDLFSKKRIINRIDADKNDSRTVDGIEYFNEIFDRIVKEDEGMFIFEAITGRIHHLDLNVYYNGFKNNGTNTFGLTSQISIYFEEFKYHITKDGQNPSDKNILITKLYSEDLTQNDIKDVVKFFVGDFFVKLKDNIKN